MKVRVTQGAVLYRKDGELFVVRTTDGICDVPDEVYQARSWQMERVIDDPLPLLNVAIPVMTTQLSADRAGTRKKAKRK